MTTYINGRILELTPHWYSINRGKGCRSVTQLTPTTADYLRALRLDVAGPFRTRREARSHGQPMLSLSIADRFK